MTSKKAEMPPWDELLSAGARLQSLVPGAVLVGGTAAAIIAGHRLSQDADHVVTDLRERFDEVLKDLESVAGWKTARVNRPVLILGSLDGIETGVRQLIRSEPLETQKVPAGGPGSPLVVIPTPGEILRIKAALVLKRNATRDYVDLAALTDHLGLTEATHALARFDVLYPQPNGQSATQQLLIQLNEPRPYDLEQTNLREYKGLDPKWHDWTAVEVQLTNLATMVMDSLAAMNSPMDMTQMKRPKGPDLATESDVETPSGGAAAKLTAEMLESTPAKWKARGLAAL